MEGDADWAASALFSPSKARLQQAQAKDWSFIEAWLIRQYGKRLPPFERNADTLQALLNLALASETADERRNAFERVEKAALRSYNSNPTGQDDEPLNFIAQELNSQGQQSLKAIARAAVDLDSPSANVLDLGLTIMDMTSKNFSLSQQIHHVERQRAALKQEQKRLSSVLSEYQTNGFGHSEDLTEDTAEWQRKSKHLRAKLGEYVDRLAVSEPSSHRTPKITDIQSMCEQLKLQRNELERLQAQSEGYEVLPNDPEKAQRAVQNAIDELRALTVQRDQLFEDLASTP